MAAASSPGEAAGAPPGPRCGNIPARAAPAAFGPSLRYPSRAPGAAGDGSGEGPDLGRPRDARRRRFRGGRPRASHRRDPAATARCSALGASGRRPSPSGPAPPDSADPADSTDFAARGDPRQLARDPVRRHDDAAGELEVERMVNRIHGKNGCTRERRLAEPQTGERLLLADVAADEEGRVHPFEVRELHAEPRPPGGFVLVAEVRLAETVVEVRAAEPPARGPGGGSALRWSRPARRARRARPDLPLRAPCGSPAPRCRGRSPSRSRAIPRPRPVPAGEGGGPRRRAPRS